MDISIALIHCSRDDAPAVMRAMAGLLREAGASAEFLLVDGPGGADPAPEAPEGFAVRRVSPSGEGYGAVLRAVRRECSGEWLITLEYPKPEDAALVFGFWHRRGEADLLIASRYAEGGSYAMPWFRGVLSRSLNWLYRKGLSLPVRDLSSAKRMYRAHLLRLVDIQGEDYDVLMEVLLKFMSKGGRVKEIPWHFESRLYRQASGTALRLVKSSLRTFWRMHSLRNSVDFPDYDYRAYDSRIWFQRYWQRKRFRIVRRFADRPGLRLDAGCGSSRIITTRPDVIAMDININRLRFLRGSNPRRLQATAGALPFPDETFEVVLSSQVIEHTRELNCIEECARVLRPGGTLIVGTPDYGRIWWPLIERVYGFVKSGGYADEHVTHYTYDSLTREIERCGCKVKGFDYIVGGELIVLAEKTLDSPDTKGES